VQTSTNLSSFDQYCISHKTTSHGADAAPGPEVRRECPMTYLAALPLLVTNPGDATVSESTLLTVPRYGWVPIKLSASQHFWLYHVTAEYQSNSVPIMYRVVGFLWCLWCSTCMSVQKLTQISGEVLYQAITDTKNRQHYRYTTRLHVYVLKQNRSRKSNLDAFVAVQERPSGAN